MAPNAPKPLVRKAFALFNEGGVSARDHRLAVSSFITWRTIGSTDDLSEVDIRAIVNTLEYWKSCGEIEYRCRRVVDKLREVPA
jgi:hypothetical protein